MVFMMTSCLASTSLDVLLLLLLFLLASLYLAMDDSPTHPITSIITT